MTRIHSDLNFCAWLIMPLVLSPALASTGGNGMDATQPLDCVISPSVVADLGSGVPGILSEVRVDRSDFVNAGDVVAELESGVEIVTLELARTRAASTAEVDLRRVNAAFGQRQNRRTKDLSQQKAVSADEVDQRQTQASLADIQLRQAHDTQALSQLEALRAEELLKRRTIKSPIAGVVMDRFKVSGEYVEDQPVVRVAQIDPLHVEVTAPVEQLGMIHKGMQAKVWAGAVASENWQATVDRVDQIADVSSGTFGIRLTMANPDHRIPAGLRCRMQFLPDSATAAQPDPLPTVPFEDSAPRMGATPEPADVASVKPVAGRLCGWLGPYDNARAARLASRPLRVDGVDVSVHQRPAKKMVGLKIVSPPLYTKAERKSYLGRLRASNVTDFIPLSKKQGAWRISLGLYRGRNPAEERVQQLEAKGFEVEIGPWYEHREKHWVLVQGDTSLLDAEVVNRLADLDGETQGSGLCSRLAGR